MRIIISFLLGLSGCGDLANGVGPTQLPAVFHIHESVPEQHRVQIHDAVARWNEALGKTVLSIAEDTTEEHVNAYNTTNVIEYVEPFGKTVTVGRATFMRTNDGAVGQALRCDIEIVGQAFHRCEQQGNVKVCYALDYMLQQVIVHELGHCLGLNHTADEKDIMFKEATTMQDITNNNVYQVWQALEPVIPGGAGGE